MENKDQFSPKTFAPNCPKGSSICFLFQLIFSLKVHHCMLVEHFGVDSVMLTVVRNGCRCSAFYFQYPWDALLYQQEAGTQTRMFFLENSTGIH